MQLMFKTKQIKAIISDFDGTIADSKREVSEKVKQAIKKWIAYGNIFSIATGRQYLMIKEVAQDLGLNSPLIVRGGAEIVGAKDGKILAFWYMDKNTVKKIVKMLITSKVSFLIEKNNVVYRNHESHKEYKYLIEKKADEIPFEDFPKLVIYIKDGTENIIETFIKQDLEPQFPELHFAKNYGPHGKTFDITSIKATKHLGILHFIKLLSLNREEVVGVGDGHNDFPLLEACGYKVAMDNAPDDLKAIADLIVPSYKEDGVAVFINNLLSESVFPV